MVPMMTCSETATRANFCNWKVVADHMASSFFSPAACSTVATVACFVAVPSLPTLSLRCLIPAEALSPNSTSSLIGPNAIGYALLAFMSACRSASRKKCSYR